MTNRNPPESKPIPGSKPINVVCKGCGEIHTVFTAVVIIGYVKKQPIPGNTIVGKRPHKCECCGYPLKYPEFLDL